MIEKSGPQWIQNRSEGIVKSPALAWIRQSRPGKVGSTGPGLWSSPPAWLLVIVVVATSLRLFRLGVPSLWHDEALSVLLARQSLPAILRLTTTDVHPPLYYLLLKASLILGQSEFVVRLPSALSGVAGVAVTYYLGRTLFDARTGLAGAAIVAVAPFQIKYAQEARAYSLFVLLVSLNYLFFLKGMEENRFRHWAAFVLCTVLGLYTNYFAVFPFACQTLFLALFRRERWRPFILAGLAVAVLFAPWVVVFLGQTGDVMQGFWIDRPSILSPVVTLYAFTLGYTLSWSPLLFPIGLFCTLFLLAVVLNAARRSLSSSGGDRQGVAFVLLASLVPIGFVYLISLIRPIYLDRSLLFTAPAYYLLLGWGVARAPRRRVHLIVALPLLILALPSLGNFYFNPRYAKEPLREASRYVTEHRQEGDLLLHTNEWTYLPALYYAPSMEQYLLPGDPTFTRMIMLSQPIVWAIAGRPREEDDVLPGHRRVWLMVLLNHSVEHQLARKRRFDRAYPLLEATNRGEVEIYLYDVATE